MTSLDQYLELPRLEHVSGGTGTTNVIFFVAIATLQFNLLKGL